MKQAIERESRSGDVKSKVSSLAFSEIPLQSRLFIDYQREPLSLTNFYPNAVTSPAGIASFIPTVLTNYPTDRGELCDALVETNENAGAGEKTFANIELLRNADTVAVVTGQQAGLFTGPIYTIYKALSAIKMAELLNERGIKAVPVFWAATEDHDFDEVSSASFIDVSGGLFVTTYSPEAYSMGTPVGSVKIDEGIDATIDALFAAVPHTEFTDELRISLAGSWSDSTFFGDAFLRTLSSILGKFGMVFLDPMNKRLRKLAAPVYAEAVRRSDAIGAGLMARGDELEKRGFHTQVHVETDYFPLFMTDENGRRVALRKAGEEVFRVKGERREFSRGELAELAENEPSRFSPGVMLRPVVQDYLLPTACYFGGGAEIAYFAQNSEVYRVLGRPVTPIFHRQSFTVIEARHRRFLEKFDLDFSGLFDGLEANLLRLANGAIASDTVRLFAETEEKINTALNGLDQSVSRVDSTLADNLAKRRRKIIYHIAAISKKTLLAKARKDETVNRQIDSVFASLLPNGHLQERSINVFSYLNKFGPNFIDWIYDAIDLADKGHGIVNL